MAEPYFYPEKSSKFTEEIKRSKFITHLQPVSSKQQAVEFIAKIKGIYPDARHWCWAYIIGNPTNTATIAMTDDGEPHGTAGKPMLAILQNRNIGDIVAVSVRYFGGIKLGTGGLVRAYSNGVIGALAENYLAKKVKLSELSLKFPFALESSIRHFLQERKIEIKSANYSNQVEISITIPQKNLAIAGELTDYTNGQVIITILPL